LLTIRTLLRYSRYSARDVFAGVVQSDIGLCHNSDQSPFRVDDWNSSHPVLLHQRFTQRQRIAGSTANGRLAHDFFDCNFIVRASSDHAQANISVRANANQPGIVAQVTFLSQTRTVPMRDSHHAPNMICRWWLTLDIAAGTPAVILNESVSALPTSERTMRGSLRLLLK